MSSLTPAEIQELLNGPGLTPPPGIIPNFINPTNETGTNIAANTICLAIATICLFIRMYTKVFLVKYGWEDCKL